MGFVGSLVGAVGGNEGGAGLNYNASGTDLLQTANGDQIQSAYNRTQAGLSQQADFVNALLGNNALGNQQNVFNQQQGLANQLQGVANGTGPNPALAQLNQATSANVANQAALMAGQRGTSANPGLLARQAAMQGGNLQQQSAGQGATLQAQQALGAMNALGNQQAQMANLANSQIGQQQAAIGNYNQNVQNAQSNLLNAAGQYNNSKVGMQSNQNSANASISQVAAGKQAELFGGIANGASSAAAAAHGGMVKKMADGGMAEEAPVSPHKSKAGAFLSGFSKGMNGQQQGSPLMQAGQGLGGMLVNGFRSLTGNPSDAMVNNSLGNFKPVDNQMDVPQLDTVPSPAPESGPSNMQKAIGLGMKYGPMLVGAAHGGGPVTAEQLAAQGEVVPGKAKVKGDNLKNDTVPAILSPGEIVIPKSVVESEDPSGNAAKFVAAIMAKQRMKHGKK